MGFLQALLRHPRVAGWDVHTRFVDEHIEMLAGDRTVRSRFFEDLVRPQPAGRAGASVDPADPLAVLAYGGTEARERRPDTAPAPNRDGARALPAVMQGTIVSVEVAAGDEVHAGDLVLVMEAMKMEHEIRATASGIVREVTVAEGDTVYEGHPLAYIEEREVAVRDDATGEAVDLDFIRPDLAEVHARHKVTLDAARPDAVAKRRRNRPADGPGERGTIFATRTASSSTVSWPSHRDQGCPAKQ